MKDNKEIMPTSIDRDGTRTKEAKLKSAKIVAAQRRRKAKEELKSQIETKFREGNLEFVAKRNMKQLQKERAR